MVPSFSPPTWRTRVGRHPGRSASLRCSGLSPNADFRRCVFLARYVAPAYRPRPSFVVVSFASLRCPGLSPNAVFRRCRSASLRCSGLSPNAVVAVVSSHVDNRPEALGKERGGGPGADHAGTARMATQRALSRGKVGRRHADRIGHALPDLRVSGLSIVCAPW
jgi:hypothetical protein